MSGARRTEVRCGFYKRELDLAVGDGRNEFHAWRRDPLRWVPRRRVPQRPRKFRGILFAPFWDIPTAVEAWPATFPH